MSTIVNPEIKTLAMLYERTENLRNAGYSMDFNTETNVVTFSHDSKRNLQVVMGNDAMLLSILLTYQYNYFYPAKD